MKTTQRTIIVTRDKDGLCLIWTRSILLDIVNGVWNSGDPSKYSIIPLADIKALFGRIPRKGGKLVFRVEAV